MAKDLDLVEEAAVETGTPTPLISRIRRLYLEAMAAGLGDRDFFVRVAKAREAAGM